MNVPHQFPGTGGVMTPIWYPPIQSRWILTILIVFAGAVAPKLPPAVRSIVSTPVGFFLVGLLALAAYVSGFPPAAFAILFFLLSAWASQATDEGYLSASNTIDWVTGSKRWYVERVLKERPVAIQEKSVSTFPIAGASAQGTTINGTS